MAQVKLDKADPVADEVNKRGKKAEETKDVVIAKGDGVEYK